MDRGSKSLIGTKNASSAAVFGLRRGVLPLWFAQDRMPMPGIPGRSVSIESVFPSGIFWARRASNCGTGFAVPLDQKHSRPASLLVNEEAEA
jgi:hypothetical protein